MKTSRILAVTAIAPIIWGTTYLVTSEILPEGRPFLAGVLRALPAGLILLAVTRSLPRGAWWWKSLVLGTLNIGAFFAFLFISAYRLPGGVSATLGAIHPLLVALLTVVVLHEAVSRRALSAAGIGLVGVAMLVLTPDAALDGVGVLAGLAGGLSTAFGVILTKKWGRPTSLLAFTGWQLIAGGLVLIVPMLAFEGLPARLTATNVAGYAWLAIAGGAVSYFLWFRGILALHPTRVTLLGFLAPLVATILGWAVLDQTLAPLQWLGAVAILGAVLLGNTAPKRAQRRSDAKASEDTQLAPASA
ncbi:EamA family transporter [Demequina sp.]|uniref:EamA family transporter n=1 Tax=Demequina sp. TaxID=2050685 RepID=UPI003D0F1E58